MVDESVTDGYSNLNGDIIVISKASEKVYVEASAVDTPIKLKDTAWYKANRTASAWD